MSTGARTGASPKASPKAMTGRAAGSRLLQVLGVSPSQLWVRALMALSSLTLVALTLVAAPHGLVVVAAALVVLTGWALWRPESAGASLLVVGLAVHWVATVPVPGSTGAWLRLLAAAWLLLLVHLAAALAASLPPSAPVPGPSLRRWGCRAGVVAAGTVPLWALAYGAGREAAAGQVSLTYAAIAATAVLSLAIWLLSREQRR